jgi:hypothetical protein
MKVKKTLNSTDGRRRILLFQRTDGYFGLEEQYWYEDYDEGKLIAEGWASPHAPSSIFETLAIAEREAKAQYHWLVVAEQMRLLQKKWRVAEAVMAQACRALPSPASEEREQFEGLISRFHEYIQHNELGLAFEALCAAAELVACRGGVWRDLERAAEFMGLHDRVPYLRERFRAAPIGGH